MDRKEVIRMALEAGYTVSKFKGRTDLLEHVNGSLERFAALVAAAKQEECAKICDQRGQTLGSILAAAIRALT